MLPTFTLPLNIFIAAASSFLYMHNVRNKWRSVFCGAQASAFCWRTWL